MSIVKKVNTEIEGWKLCVRIIKGKAAFGIHGDRLVLLDEPKQTGGEHYGGLCCMIDDLVSSRAITLNVKREMMRRIKAEGKRRGLDALKDHIWPPDLQGARLRWVHKQIRELQ
jgi:hypothetical protein